MKRLLVTADDLGMSVGINEASVLAATHGLVTSVELLAPGPELADAAARVRAAGLDAGVHLALTSEFAGRRWGAVSPRASVPSLLLPDGSFPAEVDALAAADDREIAVELAAQIDAVRRAGVEPTHLTQHMFVIDELYDRRPALGVLLGDLALRHGLAVRATHRGLASSLRARGIVVVDRVPASTHDLLPDDKLAGYAAIVRAMEPGTTELIVHCGRDDAELAGFSASGARRQRDLDLMLDGQLARVIAESGAVRIGWRALLADPSSDSPVAT